jgi:phosphoglycolate phosphatase-like HAD superfamily hydrolase
LVPQRKPVPAIAYLRTSSAANVGADKDSDKRQREAIAAFAKRAGFVLVSEYYDAAVSGADPIETRPGFAELLNRIEDNGVRIVIVEDASRFARELVTQELGIMALIKRGMRVLTANGDDLTDSSDPSRNPATTNGAPFPDDFQDFDPPPPTSKSCLKDQRLRMTSALRTLHI